MTLTIALLDWIDPEAILRAGGLLALMAVIFIESGLLVGLFLPGDSLLFIAGFLSSESAGAIMPPLPMIMTAAFIAAVVGDQVGYSIGLGAGRRFLDRPDGRFFTRARYERANQFMAEHGPRAIVLARFVPIVRTFTPLAAGIAGMDRAVFTRYNVVGALLWAAGLPPLGYALGGVSFVRDNIEVAALVIVGLSLLPVFREVFKALRARGEPASPSTEPV
jgi:membrane-associated protein